MKDLSIDFRIWIYRGNEKLLGKGRAELLERIRRSGSISEASREMKMSYRQAWQMVKEMNERSDTPLVIRQHGGTGGGGANLTEAGERAVAVYRQLESRVDAFLKSEANHLNL